MKAVYLISVLTAAMASAACNGDKANNGAGNSSAAITPVKPPKGGDWTKMVVATPAGGFMMGNPNAKLHLIEFGSLTCPHCREFDETGTTTLIDTYVKSGQVSYEFRNYVRDPLDLAASLIARCNGPASFFPLARAFYKDQINWVTKAQGAPREQLEGLQNLPPEQIGLAAAKLAGLPQWAAMRGLPEAKSMKCLTNANEVNHLVEMNANATQEYPDFPGTPTFILNGKMLEKTATWGALQPQLRNALGERG
jgi:protein-disulfide isomerase